MNKIEYPVWRTGWSFSVPAVETDFSTVLSSYKNHELSLQTTYIAASSEAGEVVSTSKGALVSLLSDIIEK